jgi:hypothetical protein
MLSGNNDYTGHGEKHPQIYQDDAGMYPYIGIGILTKSDWVDSGKARCFPLICVENHGNRIKIDIKQGWKGVTFLRGLQKLLQNWILDICNIFAPFRKNVTLQPGLKMILFGRKYPGNTEKRRFLAQIRYDRPSNG